MNGRPWDTEMARGSWPGRWIPQQELRHKVLDPAAAALPEFGDEFPGEWVKPMGKSWENHGKIVV